MYAVMLYVILNKRKLHFPLAKNVMHSPSIIGERERARLESIMLNIPSYNAIP